MSCQPPKVFSARYALSAVPSAGDDRNAVMVVNYADTFAAIELDCSSEIDCAMLEDGAKGLHYVTVGSPALGPLPSPVRVLPWRRVLPWSSAAQGYTATPLLKAPPIIALKFHTHAPCSFQQRRAPTYRQSAAWTAPAAYAAVAEFPLFGMSVAKLRVSNDTGGETPASLGFRVYGATYLANAGHSEGDPYAYQNLPELSLLVLDATGATARTVAGFADDTLTIEAEPFDTLIVYGYSAAAAATGRATLMAQEKP